MIRVLIVDDSPLMRRVLGSMLTAAGGFEVAHARNGVEALTQLHAFKPDVVTLDVQMPEMDGLACLNRIMLEHPVPVVMVSAQTTAGAEATLRALQLGAVDFVPKPDGVISLAIDDLAPTLIEKLTAASKVRLRKTHRLAERLRTQVGKAGYVPPAIDMPAEVLDELPAPGIVPAMVLVGCSTGGPPALDALLSPLPADFPWPILVAQHMPAAFTGPLAQRLNGICALDVIEVTQPTPLAPGHIYIGHGDADLIVGARPVGLVALPAPSKSEYRWHPSVDRMVDSAMGHVDPARLIGVLMTGMGNDGATAMTRLKAAGGRTIAESEETAIIWGMPGELVKAGGAGKILPLHRIAGYLATMADRS